MIALAWSDSSRLFGICAAPRATTSACRLLDRNKMMAHLKKMEVEYLRINKLEPSNA